MLINENYKFISETDSEVIANLLSYNYKCEKSNNIINAITKTINMLEGTWGICILCIDNPNTLYCTKNGSPILVGVNENCAMVVSEKSAFDEEITKYIILNNNDICIIEKNNTYINVNTTHKYNFITTNINDNIYKPNLGIYPHWTLKEIYEQRETTLRAISCGGR